MKPVIKHIITAISALLVIACMVFGLWMSHHSVPVPVCEHLRVQILDFDQRQYVTSGEIMQLIQSQGLCPVGKKCNCIALQPVEDAVSKHSMVRHAECYKTISGDVVVAITQREPLLRVVTEAETYFVDTDGKMMPVRASVTTPVLVATGQVSHRMACQQLSAFALWLQQNKYWHQRIVRAQVLSPHMVHLIQTNGDAEIVLGEWQGYERKLNKMRHWYEADTVLHQHQYPQVDLRFQGQVIGIKPQTR